MTCVQHARVCATRAQNSRRVALEGRGVRERSVKDASAWVGDRRKSQRLREPLRRAAAFGLLFLP